MRTVHEVSRLTGVSIRTLQYYDRIGLLHPAGYTESGYRLYDDASLEKLQQILLFRELEFPLKEIRRIMENPDFDQAKALSQQIDLLTLRRRHLDDLLKLARQLQRKGENNMDFTERERRFLELLIDSGNIIEAINEIKKSCDLNDAAVKSKFLVPLSHKLNLSSDSLGGDWLEAAKCVLER